MTNKEIIEHLEMMIYYIDAKGDMFRYCGSDDIVKLHPELRLLDYFWTDVDQIRYINYLLEEVYNEDRH